MISYVTRHKKLTSKKSNNYRKLHGEPMMRWKALEKAALARFIRPIAKKHNRYAIGLRFSIPIIDEVHEYKGVNYEVRH